MAETDPLKSRYEYNRRSMRYRDRRTGQWVSTKTVKRATIKVINASKAAMRTLAQDMAGRRIKLGEWQRRMEVEIKNLHVSMAMAGAGGMAQMTPRDYGRVGARLRFEYSRLQRFAEQIKAREVTMNMIESRVDMYVSAGHISHEAARKDQAYDQDYKYESNVLGRTDQHCRTKDRPGCIEQTRLGRVPIGSLVPVGERQCISRCDCSIKYHRKPKAVA